MPVIGGQNPTVNIQLPVPAPAPMTKKPKPTPAAPPEPTPAAAPPAMQAPPPGLGTQDGSQLGQNVPIGIPPPQPTAFLLPWMPEAPKQRALPMRRLHGPKRYMSTGDALFKAIQENPHDKTNQGAFADYLEEEAPHLATPTVLERLRSPEPMWVGMSPKGKVNVIPRVTKQLLEGLSVGYLGGRPYGDFFHVHDRQNRGKDAFRVRVSGRMQTWKTRPNEFRLPVKHGMYRNGEINHTSAHEWLTEDPTGEPS